MQTLEFTRPDDWHLHLRDGEMLARVLPYTARVFGRAIVMPNLDPPIESVAQAEAYRERIRKALPPNPGFEPLMTLYLTEQLTSAEIERAAAVDSVAAVKFYPKGATTHSEFGVDALDQMAHVLEALEKYDLPLLVHGESTEPECDVFDREKRFLDAVLRKVIERFPGLRVVFEHITTAEAATFVEASPANVAATITPHHLLLNRNAIFEGGLRPHHYCLPVLKRESDRLTLLRAATGGDPSFFLGTDSAPHERARKESDCGCAGIFSAPVAIESYAEAFAEVDALDRLEGFASHFGADFYGLPRNQERIRLERVDEPVQSRESAGPEGLEIFRAGLAFRYRFAGIV